ncbi:reverse transcriptase domain-containing protein [Microcoleus sp. Pol11C3]
MSPLMGALYLKPLDDRMADFGCFYVCFMDDLVVLAPTRWRLRKAIKAVNEVMADLRVEQHPDKTFIGRIALRFLKPTYNLQEERSHICLHSIQKQPIALYLKT